MNWDWLPSALGFKWRFLHINLRGFDHFELRALMQRDWLSTLRLEWLDPPLASAISTTISTQGADTSTKSATIPSTKKSLGFAAIIPILRYGGEVLIVGPCGIITYSMQLNHHPCGIITYSMQFNHHPCGTWHSFMDPLDLKLCGRSFLVAILYSSTCFGGNWTSIKDR